jgi:hypothetical protein
LAGFSVSGQGLSEVFIQLTRLNHFQNHVVEIRRFVLGDNVAGLPMKREEFVPDANSHSCDVALDGIPTPFRVLDTFFDYFESVFNALNEFRLCGDEWISRSLLDPTGFAPSILGIGMKERFEIERHQMSLID